MISWKINCIRDLNRINSSNFKTKLLKLSDEIDQFSAKIIDVRQ